MGRNISRTTNEKVPANWWNSIRTRELHDGKIKSFNVLEQKWMLELDSEPDDEYGMAYDAVYAYVDEGSSTYDDYRLPADPTREEVDAAVEVQDDNNQRRYTATGPDDWESVDVSNGETGRPIEPLPWTGGTEEFSVNATEEEIASFKNSKGEIRFEKLLQWTLPNFGDNKTPLFEWQAARMRNYMTKIVNDPERPFKLKYYKGNKVITGDHVARFYGCLLAKMLSGTTSNHRMFSTRDVFDAVEPVKSCMPLDAMRELTRCLHYTDDWEDEDGEWQTLYTDPKVEAQDGTAQHRKKFSMVEDAYNRRWQEMVNFGKWLTADESRVAGWYQSAMTIGPEPKPVRTGATIHSLCVTKGLMRTYKLFVRVYGGKYDDSLNVRHPNTASLLKFVTLYSIMLESFTGRGHCLVMDSAYMGDVMALIGRHEWKINMVGTVQSNRSGGGKQGLVDTIAALKKGTYDMLFYQHTTEPLTYTIWADNNFVKTLSNFHRTNICVGGVKRKRRNEAGRREFYRSEVDCPEQMKAYCETFHLIDKGNAVEAKFDLGGESHLHGWSPKLASRLFNMHLNNVYRIYCTLLREANYEPKLLRDCIADLTIDLLQQGEPMRRRSSGAPPIGIAGTQEGRKIRVDAKDHFDNNSSITQGRNHPQTPLSPDAWNRSTTYRQKISFNKRLKNNQWISHQSVATVCKNDGGNCQYNWCPGLLRQNKRKRSYPTRYRCSQCSIAKGHPVYLCNTTKKKDDGTYWAVLCHMKYHEHHFGVDSRIASEEEASTDPSDGNESDSS